MRKQNKEYILNAALFVFSILFSLVLVEFFLRSALPTLQLEKTPEKIHKNWVPVPERIWTEYHPVLGWYHIRSHEALHQNPHFPDTRVIINQDGFRSEREYKKGKDSGRIRGVFLGDSFTFGFGVDAREAFPRKTEEFVTGFEALNAGVAGYGIDQIYLLYREIGVFFETDYVFIGIFPEDFWRATRRFADSGHAKPYFTKTPDGNLKLHQVPVPAPYQMRTGQFATVVEQSSLESWLMKSCLYPLIRRGFLRLGKNLRLLDPDTTAEWTLGKVILEALIAEIRKNGAEPVLLLLPPDRWVRYERKTSLHKSLIRFADQRNLILLDPTEDLYKLAQETAVTDYYIEGDWHWTPKGHEVMARKIAAYLQSKGESGGV